MWILVFKSSKMKFHFHMPHFHLNHLYLHHHHYHYHYHHDDVHKRYIALMVGGQGEEPQRFVIPIKFINHPLFKELLKKAEKEYGFCQKGVIRILCLVGEFKNVQDMIQQESQSSHHHHHRLLCFWLGVEKVWSLMCECQNFGYKFQYLSVFGCAMYMSSYLFRWWKFWWGV